MERGASIGATVRTRASRNVQLTFERRGGRRRGAGRKRLASRAQVSHRTREGVSRHTPALVTLRLEPGPPSLRRAAAVAVFEGCIEAAHMCGVLRVVHFSLQSNHVHLIVEANGPRALARGMQGLAVRLARAWNKLWKRSGSVFADRYHSRALSAPREVRNALVYVLQNARKHGLDVPGIDRCSSGAAFDGWSPSLTTRDECFRERAQPVAKPRTWLLRVGWRRHGAIDVDERPGARIADDASPPRRAASVSRKERARRR